MIFAIKLDFLWYHAVVLRLKLSPNKIERHQGHQFDAINCAPTYQIRLTF